MCDRIDPPNRDDEAAPWPHVEDLSRCYDPGWAWCVNAAGHPDLHGGYPDAKLHRPWFECRGREAFVTATVPDLEEHAVAVSVYLAAPFCFGHLRADLVPAGPRVVLEVQSDGEKARVRRVSFAPGEALRLARISTRLADEITFPDAPV